MRKMRILGETSREKKAQEILELLRQDFRMGLSVISQKTGMPISTVFSVLEGIRENVNVEFVSKNKQ